MIRDVVQADGSRGLRQKSEDTASRGEVTDSSALLIVDARRIEACDHTELVEGSERRVLRVANAARQIRDLVQQRLEL